MAAGGRADSLRTLYDAESERIRREFEASQDGRAVTRQRTALIDSLVSRLWQEYISPEPGGPAGLVLVAIGGYGRGELFPHSDIDLLFLCEKELPGAEQKDRIRQFCQDLWDVRLKLSPTTRLLEDCDRLHRDNLEFNISLLDCRCLAGDQELFRRLHDQVIPRTVVRDWQEFVRGLSEVNVERRRKMGDTIFHLEPNVKETPGGLRDYHLACWLSLLNGFSRSRRWVDASESFPPKLREQSGGAIEFLSALRCFLHYRAGRDEDTLSWEAQDAAAQAGIGFQGAATETPVWMRRYFRRTRSINRLASLMLDDVVPARSSIYQQFQSWRSRLSSADFAVVNGRVYLQQTSAAADPEVLLRVFEFVAQHGFKLAGSTEQRIEQALPAVSAQSLAGPLRWQALRNVITRPHAGMALRSMQELGVLGLLLPEFRLVDSLVIRDFYHRYTVDEHTFRAIDALQRLHGSTSEQERHFAELLGEIERPDLFYLAMLLHDLGKAEPGEDHVDASLMAASRACADLALSVEDTETVSFLIAYHLDMSAAMRRDIFDPGTLQTLAQAVGSPERLKMLCLLTYADISAVNPDALTPWKAENLWRLYVATANRLDRSVDDERFHADTSDQQMARIRLLAPRLGAKRVREFLEGLPRRYLRLHSPQDIVAHMELAAKLRSEPVQTTLRRNRDSFEMTIVTGDQPALFAKLAGILAAWGMNIIKADAFSNAAGVVVDTFFFTDRFHTLELNLQEWERFQRSFVEVLTGRRSLEALGSGRKYAETRTPKVRIEPRVQFDEGSAVHSTLVEMIAQDRPGLLYRIASVLAEKKCNIEVALIDTEGEMAIDVFYLTWEGKKLSGELISALRNELLEELQPAA
ncbi:MAG: [protein-PII] uridylyltransferase [Candidatus Korobacteraceae bacterium]|jgi:[protein-PII] uridylyltransferase